jgi:hypothetical protein
MASPSTSAKTTTFALPRLRDLIEHDDEDDDYVEEEEDDDDWDVSKRMSRLSVAGSDGGDADDEDDGLRGGDDDDEEEDEVRSDGVHGEYGSQPWSPAGNLQPPSSASLPGTPERGAPSRSPWSGQYSKDYASETEAAWRPGGAHDARRQQHRRQRMMREVWLDRAWQMRKQRRELGEAAALVVVGKGGGGGESPGPGVAMDLDEVRACRDLGFDLPCDWTVEIPTYAVPTVDTGSSGGNSPASGSWRISSPGEPSDPIIADHEPQPLPPAAPLIFHSSVCSYRTNNTPAGPGSEEKLAHHS